LQHAPKDYTQALKSINRQQEKESGAPVPGSDDVNYLGWLRSPRL